MKRHAFTLVELLVVITILASLMAFSFPVLKSCRDRAQAAACLANIHQLLLGLQSYDHDHQSLPCGFDFRGGTPPPGGYIGNILHQRPGWWWFHYSGVVRHRSAEELKALRCPASRLDDPELDFDVLCGKYGVNRSLCKVPKSVFPSVYKGEFLGRPASLSHLHHSAETLLAVDSGYSLLCWWNATADPPVKLSDKPIENTAYVPGLALNKSRLLWPGQSMDAVGGRHPNRTVNIGFADGHAAPAPASDLLVEKTGDGSYTNTLLWQGR